MEIENTIVRAFIDSLTDALNTMAMLEVEVESMATPADKIEQTLDYSAVVGLAGDSDGVLVITLTALLAQQIVGSMLGMSEDEFDGDADVLDGVGEIGNIVAGNLKALLPGPSDLSVPIVEAGASVLLDLDDESQTRVCVRSEGQPLWIQIEHEESFVENNP